MVNPQQIEQAILLSDNVEIKKKSNSYLTFDASTNDKSTDGNSETIIGFFFNASAGGLVDTAMLFVDENILCCLDTSITLHYKKIFYRQIRKKILSVVFLN